MSRGIPAPDGGAAAREAKLLYALTAARQQLAHLAGDRGAAVDGSAGFAEDIMRTVHLEVLRVVDDAIEGPFPALEAFRRSRPESASAVHADVGEAAATDARGLTPAEWSELSDDLAELSSYVGAGLPDRVYPATIASRIREGVDILTGAQFDDAQAFRQLRANGGTASRKPVLAWDEDGFKAYNRAFDLHVAIIGDQFVLRGPLTAGGVFESMEAAKGRAQRDIDVRLSMLVPAPEEAP